MINRRQLAVFRDRNERYMTDTVLHMRAVLSTGSYGESARTYTTAATYACGFAFSPFKFRAREIDSEVAMEISEVLVRARLPQSAQGQIESEDRLVLIKKWGETLDTPVSFEVQGFEEMVLPGIIVNLKRIEL
jgi:hypothetical protein